MMDGKSTDKETLVLISKIAPLAGLLGAAITVFSDLPILLRYIIVVLLALVTVVSIYAAFGQPLIKFIKKKAMARKHRALTREYFKKFKKLVERFRERMYEDHCDTIPFILRQLENGNPKYVNILPHPQNFKSAVDACHEAMGKLPVTKDNFLVLVGWFESILNLCNEHLICKPIDEIQRIGQEEIRRIGQDGIPEHLTEDYKRCKAIYDRFLDDYERCKALYDRFLDNYMDFAKDMNNQFGEKVARDYFPVPKGLRK